MKEQKGFTMIELIIVIALLAILSVVGMSRFANTGVFTQRAIADQVALLLKTAQKVAITQRRSIYIVQSSTEIRACYTNTNPCPDNQSVSAQTIPLSVKPRNITVSLPAALVFNSQGVVSNGNLSVIVGTKTLTIEATTGYVHD